jgi:L-asparaginase II
MTSYLPILELTRGEMIESVHFGAVVVSDSNGRLVAWHGDPGLITTLRSSAKPFQALPLIEHGGQIAFQLTLREIALICASHHGTDEHVAVLQSIQAKTGVQETDLLCGVHNPYDPETAEALRRRGEKPTPSRHNCSGKHTGMLAYGRLKYGEDKPSPTVPYIDRTHPVQVDIRHTLAQMCDLPDEGVALGIDGCSVPTFAVPLRNAALALARLCDPKAGLPEARAEACRVVVEAMTGHPDMVGGPTSFDTQLIRATGGRVLSKGGAEGYHALAVLPGAIRPGSPALGITIKISDGDLGAHSRRQGDPTGHARPAVALEILRQLGAIEPEALSAMAEYGPQFPIYNWRKLLVGEARTCFTLQRA